MSLALEEFNDKRKNAMKLAYNRNHTSEKCAKAMDICISYLSIEVRKYHDQDKLWKEGFSVPEG